MNAMPPDVLEAVAALRAELFDAGYRPIALYNWNASSLPLKDRGKRPKGDAWQARARRNPPEAAEARVETDATCTGILCDGLRALDLDIEDAAVAHHSRAIALSTLGHAPIRFRDNSPRCLLVYRAAEGEPDKRQIVGKLGKIEMLGRGQQFAAYGHHHTGALLRWMPEGLAQTPRHTLPAVTEAEITEFFAKVMPLIGARAEKRDDAGVRAEDPAELRTLLRTLADLGAERISGMNDLSAELQARLAAALAAPSRLRSRWTGDISDLRASGRDCSRSGQDFSVAALLKGAGFSPADVAACLLAFEHGSAFDETKHPDARTRLRYVARSALRASTAPQRSDAERSVARLALRMLRAGAASRDVLSRINAVNTTFATPVQAETLNAIALWAARTAGAAHVGR